MEVLTLINLLKYAVRCGLPVSDWRRINCCGDFYLKITTLTTDKHPCTRRDANPQSQQASDLRPTP